MEWKNYIHSNAEILLGKPVVKGTRLSVEFILSLYEKGWSEQMIIENYPSLTPEILRAVFAYTKECMQNELVYNIKVA
jgi:uncharacterized protein (DUF433 family)